MVSIPSKWGAKSFTKSPEGGGGGRKKLRTRDCPIR